MVWNNFSSINFHFFSTFFTFLNPTWNDAIWRSRHIFPIAWFNHQLPKAWPHRTCHALATRLLFFLDVVVGSLSSFFKFSKWKQKDLKKKTLNTVNWHFKKCYSMIFNFELDLRMCHVTARWFHNQFMIAGSDNFDLLTWQACKGFEYRECRRGRDARKQESRLKRHSIWGTGVLTKQETNRKQFWKFPQPFAYIYGILWPDLSTF